VLRGGSPAGFHIGRDSAGGEFPWRRFGVLAGMGRAVSGENFHHEVTKTRSRTEKRGGQKIDMINKINKI
jgi:hypothetical protein